MQEYASIIKARAALTRKLVSVSFGANSLLIQIADFVLNNASVLVADSAVKYIDSTVDVFLGQIGVEYRDLLNVPLLKSRLAAQAEDVFGEPYSQADGVRRVFMCEYFLTLVRMDLERHIDDYTTYRFQRVVFQMLGGRQ